MVWAVAVAGLKRSPALAEGECGSPIASQSMGHPPKPRTSADSVTHPTKEASECRRGNGSDRRNTEVSTGR